MPASCPTPRLTRLAVLTVAGVTTEVDVDVDVVGLALLDELHAATDSAVTPATVRTANRVSRGVGQLAGIEVS
ncbi:hypothetical protein A9X03_06535, partial [Mycobacterium sp. E1715]|uniref:hypothetical protein n=1 Tax=Mycobacterium sp. E1715 TaxID=1856863 RepID=UPI0007FFB065